MQGTPATQVWRARPEESATVAGLLVEFRNWLGRPGPAYESLLATVDQLMTRPDSEFLLGRAGRGVPPGGVCQLRFRLSVWRAAEDCWLEDLFVCEEARRSGLGAAMVEASLERARERGCAVVDLDVNEENRPAVGLYERFGFSASAKPGGGRDLLMRRAL